MMLLGSCSCCYVPEDESAMPDLVDHAALLGARLLIVDDQPPNVLLLRKMLQGEGYTDVVGTTDPRQVLGLYLERPFDIILLDIRMPHLDGFGVMEQLRGVQAADDYVAILVLTAQSDDETRLRALAAGATDFVTKPFNRLEVLNRIRNILQVRMLHNRMRLENDILEQRVRERTAEINETRLEIIRRLGRAAEYRDNETGLHIIRMSTYSQMLALQAGLGEEHAELILNASPMHDIGKLGIPDRVLLKPGRLNDEEWGIMKTHAHIGAEILSGHHSELMQAASRIALCHHEKWDGSGYPQGLAGEDIPVEARIVAVADVFDALTSARPYKRAWSVEDALAELCRGAGSHFSPVLVEHFMTLVPQVRQVMERYAEPV
jgi:cyclic di-GMP phosphodiesterase